MAVCACRGDDANEKPGSAGSLPAMASVVNEASQALLEGLLGEEVAARWKFPPSAEREIARIGRALKRLGAVDRLVTVVELEAVREQGNPGHVTATVAVFPDGKVVWAAIGARAGTPAASSVRGIESVSPDLAGGVQAMVAMVASDECLSLPLVAPDDVASFPPAARKFFRDPSAQLPRVCSLMKGQSDGWSARVDGVTLVVSGGDRLGVIRSGFDVAGQKLALRTPSFKAM